MPSILIIQTLLLPLSLSLLLFLIKPNKNSFSTVSFLFIWLLSYFWIMGFAALKPTEALDWLWISCLVILFIFFLNNGLWKSILIVIVFITSFMVYGWPIIQYQLDFSILFDLSLVIFISIIIIFRTNRLSEKTSINSAIIFFISSSSLAIVVGINGSLLIAQLSAALAATLAGFVFIELRKHRTENYLNNNQIILSINIYLALLFIGKIYAELPLYIIISQAVSPITVVLAPKRFNWVVSLLLSFGSVLWFLFTLDVQEYN